MRRRKFPKKKNDDDYQDDGGNAAQYDKVPSSLGEVGGSQVARLKSGKR